jgi:hypothetical protein
MKSVVPVLKVVVPIAVAIPIGLMALTSALWRWMFEPDCLRRHCR